MDATSFYCNNSSTNIGSSYSCKKKIKTEKTKGESSLKVLIACEFSGITREAFTALGHDATSCDLRPTEIPGKHYKGDVRDILYNGWDLMVAFPPCEHLCISGARWFKEKQKLQNEALDFISRLLCSPIPKIAIENPKGIISTKIRPPDQIIQPWQFGEEIKKGICLWLKNLPKLVPTKIIPEEKRHWQMPYGSNYQKSIQRSRTLPGIAQAMGLQWGRKMIEVITQ